MSHFLHGSDSKAIAYNAGDLGLIPGLGRSPGGGHWNPLQYSCHNELAKGLRTPREFDYEGQWDLIKELPQDRGNRLLEGTNKTLCTPGPRKKEQCPHKRLSRTCLCVSRSLLGRHGSKVACYGIGSTEYNSKGINSSEGGHHYHHYPYHSLASGQPSGREHSWTIDRKLD